YYYVKYYAIFMHTKHFQKTTLFALYQGCPRLRTPFSSSYKRSTVWAVFTIPKTLITMKKNHLLF
ncbi:MAG: hypothetical protein ACTSSH_09145, partial [Candidatus Heimdallarchaeota archaeon]